MSRSPPSPEEDEQLRAWRRLQDAAPPRPRSKPSAAELQALKAHREKEKALLASLSPELRQRLTGKRPKASPQPTRRAQDPVDALEVPLPPPPPTHPSPPPLAVDQQRTVHTS